jgi:hypothetical protein
VEHPENNENVLQKCKVKFKILSLKVKGPMEYAPELVSRFSCIFILFLPKPWLVKEVGEYCRGEVGEGLSHNHK